MNQAFADFFRDSILLDGVTWDFLGGNMQAQPDFVMYDQKGREAFLSQIGTFTPSEREAFHKLSRLWTQNLPYSSALSVLSADSPSAKTDLHSLMGKLQKMQCGIIRTVVVEGVRNPQFICMCNPGDSVFYQKYNDELLYDVVEDLTNPLPTVHLYKEKGIEVPALVLQAVSYAELAKASTVNDDNDQLFAVQGPGQVIFTVLKSTIKRFLTVAIAKFQAYFQNTNFLSVVAQLKNTSLMELRKQLTQKDPLFWHEIADFILSSSKELTATRKLTVDDQLFSIAYFIRQFLAEQMAEQRKRRETEIERATDLKTIAEKIRSALTLVVEEKDFAETLLYYKPKYGDDFSIFKEEFQKQFLDTAQSRSLPVIVHVAGVYVHMDNVHAWFLQNVSRLGQDLLAYYLRRMESYIKHSADPGYEVFYSVANFDEDIITQVRDMSKPMAELLDRPNLVAEAMIHSVRKQKDVKNPIEIKQILSGFFHTDKIRFLTPSAVFGLNISDIYRIAFLKTGIIRQLILKITGKHDSFMRKFASFIPNYSSSSDSGLFMGEQSLSDSLDVPNKTSSKRLNAEVDGGHRNLQSRKGAAARAAGRSSQKSSSAKVAAPPPPPPKPKQYSENERKEAWDTFSKTIKK